MRQIYTDGTYLGNNPSWHQEDSSWKAKQIARILEANALTPRNVCEVGCGAGEVLSQLSKLYGNEVHFYGYEISPQAHDLCKKLSKANLTFVLQDLLEENSATFDVVLAIDVIEHVEDVFGFLRKLKDKGKYKIFHIPLDLSVQTVLRSSPIAAARESVGHIHYFTKEIALELLKDTGYEIVDFFYTASSLELPNRGWKSKLLSLPRKCAFSINEDWAVRVLGGYSLLVLAQ